MGVIQRTEFLVVFLCTVTLALAANSGNPPVPVPSAGTGSGNTNPNQMAVKNIQALKFFYNKLVAKKEFVFVTGDGTMSQTVSTDQATTDYGVETVQCLAQLHKKSTAKLIIVLTGTAALASNRLIRLGPKNFVQQMAAISADYIRLVQLKQRLTKEAASACLGINIKANDPILTALGKAVKTFA